MSGQGVDRITAILQVLGNGPRNGMRLTDVSNGTKLNKATVHRLLTSLCRVGFVEQDELTGLFHLGFEMFALGATAVNRFGLSEMARPHLSRLEAKTQDTIYLSVRSGNDAVCVDRHEGSYPVKVLTLAVGDRRPLGIGGASLALLAFLPDSEIEVIMRANRDKTAALPGLDEAKLYSLIRSTRRQGFAYFDGLVVPEMSAIGIPVRDRHGRVIAAVGVAAINSRMKSDRRSMLVKWANEEIQSLQDRLSSLSPP